MQTKLFKKYPLLLIGFVGIIFAIFIFLFITFSPRVQGSRSETKISTSLQLQKTTVLNKISTKTEQPTKTKKANQNLLKRLTIPTIKLDATLESVGLTSQGAAGTPTTPTNAAWLNTGPLPGDIGSAVITGHFGHWKNGANGVFNNLNKIKPGDKILVEYKNDVVINFSVRKTKIYNPNDTAVEVFSSDDNKSHLNLITCEGAWDPILKSYSKRLVVFADKD